ncbi:conserved hypothetical protein [Paecilomyces variotii No. 5]|uniref:Uncharacterized protein n=1 Tax=Byssochlamys spectabilis (strain No. 5 / NBRC 109023) TaxID=1356009 RepID=V5G682_BYSSN|nr:conserved hypothetical protein [Paecilomyces variotii No. 5]
MALPRTAAFRTLFRAGARASSRVSSRCGQQLGRRTYASHGGHGGEQKSSDLPWAVGSIAITVPSAYFLLSSGSEVPHGHEHEQVPKGVAEPEQEEAPKEEAQEESKEESKDESEEKKEEKKEEPEESKDEGKEEPKEEEKEPKQEKAPEGEKPSQYDEPGAVKNVDGAGKTAGATSGKQEGLSNANTSHPNTTAPGKSTKSEDDVDTAKVKGSVDPQRPQK